MSNARYEDQPYWDAGCHLTLYNFRKGNVETVWGVYAGTQDPAPHLERKHDRGRAMGQKVFEHTRWNDAWDWAQSFMKKHDRLDVYILQESRFLVYDGERDHELYQSQEHRYR